METPVRPVHNKRPAGALFPPAFAQICLPYMSCRFSPPVIAPQASSDTKSLLRFWFRNCLNADKLPGALNTVVHGYGMHPWVFTSSLSNSAVLVATFYASFTCFGDHELRPRSKGAGKVKSSVKETNSFLCLSALEKLYRKRKKTSIHSSKFSFCTGQIHQ